MNKKRMTPLPATGEDTIPDIPTKNMNKPNDLAITSTPNKSANTTGHRATYPPVQESRKKVSYRLLT